MNKISCFIFLCALLALIACGTETTKDNNSKGTSIESKLTTQKTANPKLRSQALAVLDHRIKNDPESYAIIEAGVLTYQFVYDGRSMSKPDEYAGDWIDFKPDFTYTYGKRKDVMGKGRYHFSMEKMQLVMVDDKQDEDPQEWNIKSGGDILIFIGSRTYGNNAYQMKLERANAIPQ